MVTLERDVHLENAALDHINDAGTVIVERDVHPENASSPTDITVEAIVNSVMETFSNEWAPMDLTPFITGRAVICVMPLNA